MALDLQVDKEAPLTCTKCKNPAALLAISVQDSYELTKLCPQCLTGGEDPKNLVFDNYRFVTGNIHVMNRVLYPDAVEYITSTVKVADDKDKAPAVPVKQDIPKPDPNKPTGGASVGMAEAAPGAVTAAPTGTPASGATPAANSAPVSNPGVASSPVATTAVAAPA